MFMGGEFALPEPIIQRIQSFLTGKDAARTTVLSKSWHTAWLTRPNLHFDDSDFQRNRFLGSKTADKFSDFAKKTIQRYEESNLNIESFRLCTQSDRYNYDDNSIVEVEGLIVKALKMGATNVYLRLNNMESVLPHAVFGSENLFKLSVRLCKVDLGVDRQVRCSRLKSLSLKDVYINSDVISNILSSCPLIEKLSMSYVNRLVSEKQGLESVGGDLISHYKLRCLVLCGVKFDTLFLGDLSSKFPSLKDLTLELSSEHEQEETWISSRSLERLTFVANRSSLRIKFDVPSIHEFEFYGSQFPSLSFSSTSREWESHVDLMCYHLDALWFCNLNRLLAELNMSKIHLSLDIDSTRSFDYEVEELQGLPKHQLENLIIDMDKVPSLSCYALLDGLFHLCRPKSITQYLLPESGFLRKRHYHFLCKTLLGGMDGKFSEPSNFMYGLHDLEEVNVQIFDEVGAVWRPLPLESLMLDTDSTIPQEKQEIRFQLKWKA